METINKFLISPAWVITQWKSIKYFSFWNKILLLIIQVVFNSGWPWNKKKIDILKKYLTKFTVLNVSLNIGDNKGTAKIMGKNNFLEHKKFPYAFLCVLATIHFSPQLFHCVNCFFLPTILYNIYAFNFSLKITLLIRIYNFNWVFNYIFILHYTIQVFFLWIF